MDYKDIIYHRIGLLEQTTSEHLKKYEDLNDEDDKLVVFHIMVCKAELKAFQHAHKAISESKEIMVDGRDKLVRLLFVSNKYRIENLNDTDKHAKFTGMCNGFAMVLATFHVSPTRPDLVPF